MSLPTGLIYTKIIVVGKGKMKSPLLKDVAVKVIRK